ncbi:coiled-coil domain-containing protein 191 isoform 4-T4 [Amazona ochrocephala]
MAVPAAALSRPGRPAHQLYRWRRLTAGAGAKGVDQTSPYAVSEAFPLQKSRYPQEPCGPVTSLETLEHLQDHEEACEEAQELLSNWMKSELELVSNGEEEVDSVLLEKPSAAPLKYEQFDDLCSYLEYEAESSSVQEYLQHLLQSEAVSYGIMEGLRLEDIKENKKLTDPRITMELRHKQVKENRIRHQKALELLRQEQSLKKSLLSEARLRVQEEHRRKALKAKKEEQEIQREMVKLRREMAEKQAMAEAWRMEGKRQEKSQRLSMQKISVRASPPFVPKKQEQGEEKQRKAQELLRRIQANKQKCMQRHFSAWLKVTLEHRIKMGKAKALANWKCQLKALRAWRNYTWAQKVAQEAQQLQVHLQDQNRKKQLSEEYSQRWLLRCCFLAWRHWSQAEAGKRELQIKREENKMSQLLEAVSLEKDGLDRPLEANQPGTAEVNHHQDMQKYKQRLIEEQRQQLERQQKLILELQQNQRLSRIEEAAQATAVIPLQQPDNSASQAREEKPERENQPKCKNTTYLSPPVSHGPENMRAVMQGRRPSSQVTSTHPILKAMEERAIQRAERKRKLEEAKRQRKEEKLAQLKAEEEAHQRKEAEEKEAQQEKQREERRQQKLKELEKQRRLEREQQLQKKARDHYKKVLLRKLGMVPWKRLREQAKENLVVAQRHHCLGLQRKYLMAWLQETQRSLMEKVSRAEDFYSHILLRRGFRNWLKYKDYLSTLEERLSTLHAGCLMRRYFWAWFDLFMEEKSILWEKMKIATEHSNKKVMMNAFKTWRQYPLLMKEEREREERRNQLRRRVAEILPDFQT